MHAGIDAPSGPPARGPRRIRKPRGRCRLRPSHALAVMVLLGAAAAWAQELSVSAHVNPLRARVGETLSLVIDVRGAQNVGAPALHNLDAFEARYIGPSTQVSIVQGQMSSSVQHRFSLVARREGRFTVGPFVVEHGGERYETSPVTVEISAAAARAPAGQPSQEPASELLGLEIAVPQTELYFHERVPIEVTLSVGAVRAELAQRYPVLQAQGIAVDDFGEPVRNQSLVDGQTVQTLTYRTAIVPLQTGALTLGPASMRLNLLQRRRSRFLNSPFFDSLTTERVPRDVSSAPVSLTVAPLPEEGRPADFSGAVGEFTLEIDVAPKELSVGDPVTVRLGIRGSGNLSDAHAPVLEENTGLRSYEPTVAPPAEGYARVFEQVLVPNDDAVQAVPPVRFSFFNPRLQRYETVRTAAVPLSVRPVQADEGARIVAARTDTLPASESLGRDIIYIKDTPGSLLPRSVPWYGNRLLLFWPAVPLGLLALATWYGRKRDRLSADVLYARFAQAGREARRGLQRAETALAAGDRSGFYDAVSQAMHAYLSAKFALPPGAVGAEFADEAMLEEDTRERLRQFFRACEENRFAPASRDHGMNATLDLAREVVQRLEHERRRSSVATSHGVRK